MIKKLLFLFVCFLNQSNGSGIFHYSETVRKYSIITIYIVVFGYLTSLLQVQLFLFSIPLKHNTNSLLKYHEKTNFIPRLTFLF